MNRDITIRITALWAFSEAFLGGMLHAFKVPFTGLVLSGMAALCMALLALYGEKSWRIFAATIVVIAIKFMLSPHTPPMAYVAVGVEGLVGQILFFNKKEIQAKTFALTVFCLVYSAFQHLLVLTLVFGKEFWNALDIFFNTITQVFHKDAVAYSLYLVLLYLVIHMISGIIGGLYFCKLIENLETASKPAIVDAYQKMTWTAAGMSSMKKTKGKSVYGKIVAGILMVLLLLMSYLPFFNESMLKTKLVEIIVRGILILIAWNFFILPLIRWWLQNWLQRYSVKEATKIGAVVDMFPSIRQMVYFSWTSTQGHHTLLRVPRFISYLVMLMVYA